MGRTEPSYAPMAQQGFRKDQRAKLARATINKTIPRILASDARARKGIEHAQLFSGTSNDASAPSRVNARTQRTRRHSRPDIAKDSSNQDQPSQTETTSESDQSGLVKIRIQVADTLVAASKLHNSSRSRKNVAILNMASPLRPGGGVLNGATSQEESLCSRTTLLPSLREEWYRLPEIGGIFSPDVLVFRLPGDNGDGELPKGQRFYVDVVSAAMIRFPDVVENAIAKDVVDDDGPEEELATVERSFASQRDRDLALEKMRAVVRMLIAQKTERVVLGAWGCGAYGNPTNEVCTAWKRALLGTRSKSTKRKDQAVDLGSLKEIVFAIKDPRMAQDFAKYWGDGIEAEQADNSAQDPSDPNLHEHRVKELGQKIEALEFQIVEARTPMLKGGLEGTLHALKQQLANIDQEASDEDKDEED